MPIDIELRHDGLGFITKCHGALTMKDFIDVQNSFLVSPEVLKKLRYGIMDLTSAETLNLNYEKMVSIVERDKRLAAVTPSGGAGRHRFSERLGLWHGAHVGSSWMGNDDISFLRRS